MADDAASGIMEKDALISALRQESERLLAEQAARLSKHFEEQLSNALAALTSTSKALTLTAADSSAGPALQYNHNLQLTRPSTVATPQKSQSHTLVTRAEESSVARPVTVHTSTGRTKKAAPKPTPKPAPRLPAHLVQRYLGTPVSRQRVGAGSKTSKGAFLAEDSLPTLQSASGEGGSAAEAPMPVSKLPSVARMMLRKGEHLLRQLSAPASRKKKYSYEGGRVKSSHSPEKAAERAATRGGVDALLADCAPAYSPPRRAQTEEQAQQQEEEEVAEEEGSGEGEVHEDQAILETDEQGISSVIVVDRNNREISAAEGSAPPRPRQPRKQAARAPPPPVEGWHEQRVNEHEEQHLRMHSKADWENQVAKHVLSLYASSKVHDNAERARVVMHYVDNKRSESIQTVLDHLDEHGRMVSGEDAGDYVLCQDDDLGGGGSGAGPLSPGSRLLGKRTGLVRSKRCLSSKYDEYVKPRVPTLTTVTGEPFEKAFSKYRTCNVIFMKDGTEAALRGSPRVFPVWFVTTGEVYADWSFLPGGAKLQAQLNQMYDHHLFREYAQVLESILTRLWRDEGGSDQGDLRATVDKYMHKRHSDKPATASMMSGRPAAQSTAPRPATTRAASRPDPTDRQVAFAEGSALDDGLFADSSVYTLGLSAAPVQSRTGYTQDQLREFWRRFVLTCNSVCLTAISRGEDARALEVMQLTESLIFKDGILPRSVRDELSALLNDSWAYYFYRKRSIIPAGSFCQKSLALHERTGDVEGAGVSLVHLAACYSLQARYKDAHRTLYHFLAMVDDGRLGLTSATPKQLCLVAVAYHNLAVLQLKMGVPDLAAKSSQSARKIARLCLSYSSRYTHVLQYTHDACIDDINFRLANTANTARLDVDKTRMVHELIQEVYHPENREHQEEHRGWG